MKCYINNRFFLCVVSYEECALENNRKEQKTFLEDKSE
jgi:hypothetical protein